MNFNSISIFKILLIIAITFVLIEGVKAQKDTPPQFILFLLPAILMEARLVRNMDYTHHLLILFPK